jgi:hypothetical protein
LRHVAELQSGFSPQHAVVKRSFAAQGFQQTGFATAVTANETNAFACVDLQRSVVKQGNVAESEACAVKGQ